MLLSRKAVLYYVGLVKSLIHNKKHDEIELHGIGAKGNMKVASTANLLVKWGYATMTKIGTHHAAGSNLHVTVKKS